MKNNDLFELKKLKRPVLVTGHTGFKGTWLTLLLEKLGIEVFGLSLPGEENSLYSRIGRLGAVEESFIDIRDKTNLARTLKSVDPQVIIHLAAQPLVMKSYDLPLETFETNILGTANLLDLAIKETNCQAIAVVTTDKVYKNENKKIKFKESDQLYGEDPYSLSKVGTEAVTSAWRLISEKNSGPQIFSLRAGNVIGGGDFAENRLLPDFVRARILGNPLNLRNPYSTRPWQHVLDPLMGYLYAINASLRGEKITSFNFGPTEKSLSVSEVKDVILKKWNIEITYNEVILEKSLNESIFLDLDNTKAQNTLLWKPKWSQIEAINKTIEWWEQIIRKLLSPSEACFLDIESHLSHNESK